MLVMWFLAFDVSKREIHTTVEGLHQIRTWILNDNKISFLGPLSGFLLNPVDPHWKFSANVKLLSTKVIKHQDMSHRIFL